MDEQPVETAGVVINIDVALAVFGGQLRDLRIDDDLRLARRVLDRVAGKG